MYSIRLNPDEVASLQYLADAAGVPGSTLARSWIVERIQEEQAGPSDAEAEVLPLRGTSPTFSDTSANRTRATPIASGSRRYGGTCPRLWGHRCPGLWATLLG